MRLPIRALCIAALSMGTGMATAADLLLAAPSSAAGNLAQNKPGTTAPSKQIDLQGFSQLADLSALNICYSMAQKVEYKPAGIAATAALYTLIKEQYNSKVQGMPKAAADKKILNQWIAGNILLKASAICPTKLPKDVLNEANRIRAAQKR
jgi:hypothetical protein